MKKSFAQLISTVNRVFCTTPKAMAGYKVLTMNSINPHVKTVEYAVRGPLVIRAIELEKELAKGAQKPFKNVIKANVGDAHAMGQKPITFIRQVLACVSYPELLQSNDIPSDVKEHAKAILGSCGGGSTGAYSQSTGIEIVRQHVAKFIEQRDGIPCDSENICLSNGASDSIRNVLKLFNGRGNKKVGIMIPIPQYPLYAVAIDEFNLGQVGYYLPEDNKQGLDINELKRSFEEAKDKVDIQAIVIINPGNPTGQVLSKDNIKEIIKFAHEHKLMILADEVYQDNIYGEGCEFHSFKKMLSNMGPPYSMIELASFHSASKGYMGECGLRGGYVEFTNIDPAVYFQYKKLLSAKLCSTTLGQTVLDCVVNPPKEGDPSYDQWLSEKNAVLKSLKERAALVNDAFNKIEGISVNPVQGAMYAFPQIHLPAKAVEKAKSLGQAPDFFYAMSLLEETGVCIVPGSGFGQREGTYHFRTTILPQPEMMKDMLERIERFQAKFLKTYS